MIKLFAVREGRWRGFLCVQVDGQDWIYKGDEEALQNGHDYYHFVRVQTGAWFKVELVGWESTLYHHGFNEDCSLLGRNECVHARQAMWSVKKYEWMFSCPLSIKKYFRPVILIDHNNTVADGVDACLHVPKECNTNF
jgi:hypothetical protein